MPYSKYKSYSKKKYSGYKKKYPKSKYSNKKYKKTYKKSYKGKTYSKTPTSYSYSPRPLYTKDSVKAADLSGFDKAIYKTDKIIGQVGHGISVISKPIAGIGKFIATLI